MKLLESFRKHAFWAMDFFKGSPIRKHYNDIKFILENYDSEKSINIRKNHLKNVLNHSVQTTPFYKNINLSPELSDFPIIDKSVVRNNFEEFKSLQFINKNNTPVVTSGSTGTPFKLFHDKGKRSRNTADVIYFAKKGGFDIGSCLIYMKVWNKINTKSPFKLWLENIIPYSIFNYTDEDIVKLIEDIKSYKSECGIVCFASTCDVIVNYLDSIKAKPFDYKISSIITNSDALSNHTKDRMEKYFKVPTLSRYSSMECGLIGQQCYSGGYEFQVNWASFYIELLDLEEDKPAEPGKMGRVVITDLFNYCMPLIRYNTGDLAFLSPNKKDVNGAPVLERIEGRKVDLIRDTNNQVITSHIVTVNMWKYDELKQYQFVQKGSNNYVFRLNPWKEFLREQELINEFKGYLGNDANITIKYIDEIPLLSSGKRRLVTNETLNS